MIIRPYTLADYTDVTEIMYEAFGPVIPTLKGMEEDKAKIIMQDIGFVPKTPHEGFYIAEDQEGVLGFIVFVHSAQVHRKKDDGLALSKAIQKHGLSTVLKNVFTALCFQYEPPAFACYIDMIAVKPSARGKGVGSKLLKKAEDMANEVHHVTTMELQVLGDNPRAKALYERLGYTDRQVVNSWLSEKLAGIEGWTHMQKKIKPVG